MHHNEILIGTVVPVSEKTGSYIKQILPYGFESFSLTFGGEVKVDLPKLAEEVKEAIGDSGAVISSICVYGNPLMDDEGAKRTLDGWYKLVDATELFGCDIVAGFAGRVVDVRIDQSIEKFAEVFTPLAKKANDKGVRLAFENCDMGGTWYRGNWNIAQTPAAWDLMFEAVPFENIGLQWEPCHQMVKLIDPILQLKKYAKRVFCLHGKDATVMWDVVREHGVFGPHTFAYHRTPGFGDSNWTDIISILRMNGFKGSIDIEGWHDPVYNKELEMTGQVHALNYLKNCRGGSYVPNPE
ncbi:MAG: sugar phosphate isomerase/epimerase family protein [Armatimonadota bacterium]